MPQSDFVLSAKERYSFGFALLGQNLIYGLFFQYLLLFYTDVYGISAAAAGTLFLVARTWDAINDPLMGMLVDRTRTRWGKFRPYLLWTPIPIAALTIVCFSTPDVSPATKLLLAYVTYISWSMVYTINDVPLWALSSSMTTNSEERTGLISLARLLAIVGILIPGIFVIPMVEGLGQGSDELGYFYTATIFSIAAAGLMLLAFFNTKERATVVDDNPTIKDSITALTANRPLLMVVFMGLTNVMSLVAQTLSLYFVTYNLGDRSLMPYLTLTTAAAIVVGILPIVPMVRRLGKKWVMVCLVLVKAATSIAFYLTGYNSLETVYVMTFLNALTVGGIAILTTAMIADSIEYMQWKTGKRSEGVIFSIQTFMAKITTAIGGALGGYALAFFGYVPNAVQSPETLTAIFELTTIVPAVVGLLTLWPLYYYELNEQRHQEILSDLSERAGLNNAS